MRLRNKKTGQAGNFIINKDHFECTTLDYVPEIMTLAELNEEWEDAFEETIKPFTEVAVPKYALKIALGEYRPGCSSIVEYYTDEQMELYVADQDYYEILPDGTKKTEFTWDEAMEIEKKTGGDWRIPTATEWALIAHAFGCNEFGAFKESTLVKHLGLLSVETFRHRYYWTLTDDDEGYAYAFSYGQNFANPMYVLDKRNRCPVRCVTTSKLSRKETNDN